MLRAQSVGTAEAKRFYLPHLAPNPAIQPGTASRPALQVGPETTSAALPSPRRDLLPATVTGRQSSQTVT